MAGADPERLAALRARIDELDETLHTALIERSAIIDELIVAKGSTTSEGAVFRPGREAQMMRALRARHRGSLPLATVEEFWHLIIAAHTALQTPYRAFVDVSGDPLPAWDAARFLLGFSVPVEPCGSPQIVLEAIGEHGTALGFVPVANRSEWWRALGGEGPRILARTPVMETPHGGAGGEAPATGPTAGADAPDDGNAPITISDNDNMDAADTSTGGSAAHWVIAPALSDPVPFDVPITRLRLPRDTAPDELVADSEATIVAMAVLGDEEIEALVSGTVPDALGSLALDSIDCGGYHLIARD